MWRLSTVAHLNGDVIGVGIKKFAIDDYTAEEVYDYSHKWVRREYKRWGGGL